jgi:hypothetical protein
MVWWRLEESMLVRWTALGLLVWSGCHESAPTPTPPPSAAAAGAVVEPSDALVAESFDAAATLDGWQRMAGAQLGAAPENEVEWDDGAVRMSASRETRRWTALYREVDTGDARWLVVSAKIRTDGIDPQGAQMQNCNLFVKHGGGIAGTRVVTGTQTATVRRRFEVTPGKVTLGFFSSLPGRAWFDDIRLEKSAAPRWSEKQHGHYRYFTLPGDTIDDEALAFNEESFRTVSAYLGVSGPSPVVFRKYPDLASIEELTGRTGNAFRSVPDLESYAVGGAFVEWIDSTRGKAVLRDLYRKLDNAAPEAENRKRLEETLGPSADVDAKVRAWVEAG